MIMRMAWLALVAAMVCGGCTPTLVPTVTITPSTRISHNTNGQVSLYSLGAECRSLLQAELETWQRAGFDGFDVSFVTYAPSVSLVGTLDGGASYLIDFGQDVVVVNETDAMGEMSQYIRIPTPADRRFRLFLQAFIEDGKGLKTAE